MSVIIDTVDLQSSHPTDRDILTVGGLVVLSTMNLSGILTVADGSPAFPHPYLEPQ